MTQKGPEDMMETVYRYSTLKGTVGKEPDLGTPILDWTEEEDSTGYFRCWEYEDGTIERRWCATEGYKAEIIEYLR